MSKAMTRTAGRNVGTLKFCESCNLVRPPRGYHCTACGMCVQRMDHHCPWLGVCVGRRNYLMFFIFCNLISAYTVLCYLVTAIHLIEKAWHHSEFFLSALVQAIKANPVNLIIHLYCMVAILFVVTLQAFHQKLMYDGITTVQDLKDVYGQVKKVYGPRGKKSGLHYCRYFCKMVREPRIKSKICDVRINVVVRRVSEEESKFQATSARGIDNREQDHKKKPKVQLLHTQKSYMSERATHTDASNVTVLPFLNDNTGQLRAIPKVEDIARRIKLSYGGEQSGEDIFKHNREESQSYKSPEVNSSGQFDERTGNGFQSTAIPLQEQLEAEEGRIEKPLGQLVKLLDYKEDTSMKELSSDRFHSFGNGPKFSKHDCSTENRSGRRSSINLSARFYQIEAQLYEPEREEKVLESESYFSYDSQRIKKKRPHSGCINHKFKRSPPSFPQDNQSCNIEPDSGRGCAEIEINEIDLSSVHPSPSEF